MGGGVEVAPPPQRTPLRQWEEQHKEALEEIERKELAGKREARERAERELQQWKQDRDEQTQKRHTSNLALQKDSNSAASAARANPWLHVMDHIDSAAKPTGDGVRDTSRMLSLLIQLKNSTPP